ncbi:vacuolar protein sorting-associated protein 35 [Cryptosporidium andersoni]|uniref:Vacuolar protein sorting-associated protein 35 n=1 Tax=Cryptosporidium andersoni TaxID=117008 RepID=A0A1J4MUF1_9CRYT|nr:vacuolar protein sorting-associated protein 35 [Cryptosporidium andersoni]
MERSKYGGSQDQDSLLVTISSNVKEQAYYMKRAIDQDSLRDSLKYASNMLCELRTSSLSPKHYYELYMQIFQEMHDLSNFFDDKVRHGRKMSELYESVQHAGNIIPRLFLLVTAGACYIRSLEAPAKEILFDMSELCRGVQHPMRGLFLRYFLIQMCKDVLPDTGSEYEKNGGGSTLDSWEFLYSNFCESTRLWIRLQNHGSPKDRSRQERERHDLRILVGANLLRVSHLDGITQSIYTQEVLPKLLDVVLSCDDILAQQYLLDCIIQVFSDELHLKTLETLLAACMKTLPGVDLKPILTNLMNRLSNFLHQSKDNGLLDHIDIFELFRKHLAELHERAQPGSRKQVGNSLERDLSSLLDLHLAFLSFTLTLYPNNAYYVDIILGSTVTLLTNALGIKSDGTCGTTLEPKCIDSVVEILSLPFQSLPLSILVEMNHFPNLLYFLNYQTGKKVAISMVRTVVENNTPLDNAEALRRYCGFISPLLEDENDHLTHNMANKTDDLEQDNAEFVNEQILVAKLVHQIQHEDLNQIFIMYGILRELFCHSTSKRYKYTLPTLGYCSLKIINSLIDKRGVESNMTNNDLTKPSIKKILQFIHQIATELASCSAEIALSLFLQGAVMASRVNESDSYEAICCEFITQSLVCFEEELAESKKQFQSLMAIIGTLINHVSCLESNNYELLAAKLTQYSAKLLRKPDQCRAILMCSNLFWNNERTRDPDRVLECLQKCLKIADASVQMAPGNSALFIDILEKYMYYLEQGNSSITTDFISNLVTLCFEHIQFAGSEISEGPKILLKNLSLHINENKSIYKNFKIEDSIISSL